MQGTILSQLSYSSGHGAILFKGNIHSKQGVIHHNGRQLVVAQGHALFTRQAGSTIPCPYVDYDAGFNGILGAAYGLGPGETIEKLFGKKWGECWGHQSLQKVCTVLQWS